MSDEKKVLVSIEGLIIIGDVIIYDPYCLPSESIEALEGYKTVKVRRPYWGRFNKEGA